MLIFVLCTYIRLYFNFIREAYNYASFHLKYFSNFFFIHIQVLLINAKSNIGRFSLKFLAKVIKYEEMFTLASLFYFKKYEKKNKHKLLLMINKLELLGLFQQHL